MPPSWGLTMTHGAQIGCFAAGCSSRLGKSCNRDTWQDAPTPARSSWTFPAVLNSYICIILRSYERWLAATQSGRKGHFEQLNFHLLSCISTNRVMLLDKQIKLKIRNIHQQTYIQKAKKLTETIFQPRKIGGKSVEILM